MPKGLPWGHPRHTEGAWERTAEDEIVKRKNDPLLTAYWLTNLRILPRLF